MRPTEGIEEDAARSPAGELWNSILTSHKKKRGKVPSSSQLTLPRFRMSDWRPAVATVSVWAESALAVANETNLGPLSKGASSFFPVPSECRW